MSSGYTRFTIQDLNGDGIPSLLVLRTDADSQPVAEFYGWQDEQMGVAYRCVLSSTMASVNRGSLVSGRLDADTPALYITGVDEQGMAATDILVFRQDLGLVNLALSGSSTGSGSGDSSGSGGADGRPGQLALLQRRRSAGYCGQDIPQPVLRVVFHHTGELVGLERGDRHHQYQQ